MPRTLCHLFMTLFLSGAGFCQFPATVFPLPTDSVVWGYGTDTWGMGSILRHTYQYDTAALCGHTYGVVGGGEWMGPLKVYLRTEGDQVWARYFTSCDSVEVLVMDFGAVPGDTLWLGQNITWPHSAGYIAPYIVESADTVLMGGLFRRRFHLRYDRCYYDYSPWSNPWSYVNTPTVWVEGYGITDPYPFLFVQSDCDAGETEYCFHSMVVNHDTVWYTPCATPVGGAEAAPRAMLSLTAQPNPASGQTALVLESAASTPVSLSLYSPAGQCVWRHTAHLTTGRNEVPLPLPGPGVYMARAEAPGLGAVAVRVVGLP